MSRPARRSAKRWGHVATGRSVLVLAALAATVGRPGASLVDRSMVVGAWELPAATGKDEVARLLRARGVLDRVSDHRDGQIWSADYRTHGSYPVRFLLIDGTHRFFESRAVPEARPGPHIYLIAYRTS